MNSSKPSGSKSRPVPSDKAGRLQPEKTALLSLRDLHREGCLRLQGLEAPDLEARLLLQHSCDLSREDFAGSPDYPISPACEREFFRLVNLRLGGVPLAYLTGEKEFWAHTFRVGPGVLIPRPETELILEKAFESPPGEGEWVADIGTGCGCLALCLAEELPSRRIAACDFSGRALTWARLNASRLGIRGVRFLKGDLFQPLTKLGLDGRCGLIVSNPPYVSEEEWETLDAGVRGYEPRRALVAGPTGLELIGRLANGAPAFLKSGGRLIVEIGHGQEQRARALFGSEWVRIECFPDLAGIPRIFVAVKS